MPIGAPGVQYSSEYLGDYVKADPSIRTIDADGNAGDVSPTNPLPTSFSTSDAATMSSIHDSLNCLIDEAKKTNQYLSILVGATL